MRVERCARHTGARRVRASLQAPVAVRKKLDTSARYGASAPLPAVSIKQSSPAPAGAMRAATRSDDRQRCRATRTFNAHTVERARQRGLFSDRIRKEHEKFRPAHAIGQRLCASPMSRTISPRPQNPSRAIVQSGFQPHARRRDSRPRGMGTPRAPTKKSRLRAGLVDRSSTRGERRHSPVLTSVRFRRARPRSAQSDHPARARRRRCKAERRFAQAPHIAATPWPECRLYGTHRTPDVVPPAPSEMQVHARGGNEYEVIWKRSLIATTRERPSTTCGCRLNRRAHWRGLVEAERIFTSPKYRMTSGVRSERPTSAPLRHQIRNTRATTASPDPLGA